MYYAGLTSLQGWLLPIIANMLNSISFLRYLSQHPLDHVIQVPAITVKNYLIFNFN